MVVVGAGISGLTTAWRLASQHPELDVVVLESGPRPGGVVQSARTQGYIAERGPNGFLDSRQDILQLCTDLGLPLVRANPRSAARYLFLGDRLRKLPAGPGQFLASDVLSLWGKFRVLMERWRGSRGAGADESIRDFGIRHFGEEATDRLFAAVVTGIYAGDPALLSLKACFPRLAAMEQEHGSIIKGMIAAGRARKAAPDSRTAAPLGGTLTAPAAGMGAVVEALAERLGDRIRCGTPVRSLTRSSEGGWIVATEKGEEKADAVVLSCPLYAAAEMIAAFDAGLAAELKAVPYAPAVVASVGYRAQDLPREAEGFGYLAPITLDRAVLGVIFSSSIFPETAPAGSVQFRAILGGWRRRDVIHWSDEEVVKEVRRDLQTALGISAEPDFTLVTRWPNAIPQYHVGHLERVAGIDAKLNSFQTLFIAGNGLRGVSLDDCVRDANETAKAICSRFQPPNG